MRFNVSQDELRKMDLGSLVRKNMIFDDPKMGIRVIEYEFELGTVNKTIWYAQNAFMDALKEIRNNNIGTKSDTKSAMGTKVATIPMHIWAREVAPRQKDGNDTSLKKWLNGEGSIFKVRDGEV
jgi:hypothetical protein